MSESSPEMDNFRESFDATVWAAAFVKRAKADASFATDEGTMIGWFANALMRGYDTHANRTASSDSPSPSPVDDPPDAEVTELIVALMTNDVVSRELRARICGKLNAQAFAVAAVSREGTTPDEHAKMLPALEADVAATWDEVVKRLKYMALDATDEERRANWSAVLGAMHVNNAARNRVYMARWFSKRDQLEAALASAQRALDEAKRERETLRTALERIAEGRGAFSRDALTHAENVIEEAKATARAALSAPPDAPAGPDDLDEYRDFLCTLCGSTVTGSHSVKDCQRAQSAGPRYEVIDAESGDVLATYAANAVTVQLVGRMPADAPAGPTETPKYTGSAPEYARPCRRCHVPHSLGTDGLCYQCSTSRSSSESEGASKP